MAGIVTDRSTFCVGCAVQQPLSAHIAREGREGDGGRFSGIQFFRFSQLSPATGEGMAGWETENLIF